MVFYKDLNERFISENPANTVSECSSSLLSARKTRLFLPDRLEVFLWPGSSPIQAGTGNHPQTMHRGWGVGQSCPLQPFYPGLLFKLSGSKPCTGVACGLSVVSTALRPC